MNVYDYDGEHVGRVKDVLDTAVQVGRRWRGDVQVPLEQILAVLDESVVLTVPRAQV
jgi:sporulation protein YlmC with PRC-barrel domain